MTLPALFAFLHHVAAFTLVAALAVEFVLIREEITRWPPEAGGQAGPAAASGCAQDPPHPLAASLGAGSCRGADLLRRPHGERHRRSCLTCA